MRKLLLTLILIPFLLPVNAQVDTGVVTGEEAVLYGQTKQMNQFFRRFNNEEDTDGNRYYPGDAGYREPDFRRRYLRGLFNNEQQFIEAEKKERFVADMTKENAQQFLEFHGGGWFAEASANFKIDGRQHEVILFMELQKEETGTKWVIHKAYCDYYARRFFDTDTTGMEFTFLHPLSHELDFMNLRKAFVQPGIIEYFARRNYTPDYLTLLLYQVKTGKAVFETVANVKFHFFQIPNWYFKVEYFNRASENSGWLISNLIEINENQKDNLIKLIYYE